MIYLDHNATTPPYPEVVQQMAACAADNWANPASQHLAGQRARRQLDAVRHAIGQMLGAGSSDQVVLTSGGTEANNLALRGLAGSPPATVIISAIEHPSVVQTARFLARSGFHVRMVPVGPDGVVRIDQLADQLDSNVRLISVMLANHETGVLQPIRQVVELARPRGIAVHTDAVQAVGKIAVSFRELGVTAMTACAHKLHGPVGIGALVLRESVALEPILFGGTQQLGMRPGTESLPLAVGFEVALRRWLEHGQEKSLEMAQLRDRLEARILAGCPRAIVVAAHALRVPHTSNIAFPGEDRQMLLLKLDRAGIACSTGSACASGSSEPSPVLTAMGCDASWIRSSLRFSLGALTAADEIEEAADVITRVVGR